MPDVQVAAGESRRGTGATTTSRIFVGRNAGFDRDHGARNRHSDNEKFCNDLNRPKTPKMSEWPLKTLQDFPTSKLNTRVRFPPPAPRFSGTCWALLFPFGQACCCSFGQMSVFRSHGTSLLGAGRDLFGGALHVLRQHLDGVVPALRQDLVISQFGIAGLGQPTMTEDVKDNRHAGLRHG
jgi:hypothetical protein